MLLVGVEKDAHGNEDTSSSKNTEDVSHAASDRMRERKAIKI